MAPPCPILAGYRLVAPGPCACFPFKFVQEFACCSCVCRNLETLRLRFLAFSCGLSCGLSLQSEAGALYDNGLYISLAYLWFSLLPAALARSSCRNDSILLDPFFRSAVLFLFLVAYHRHCFVSFYSWAPMSLCFLFPFGHPRPVC